MKHKHNEGFSLIETLVAIVVLALCVVPTCSSLVLSYRLNAKTEQMMQAQLAVSSAVETLMAEGIDNSIDFGSKTEILYDVSSDGEIDRFPAVKVVIKKEGSRNGIYYSVTVTDNDELVTVTTTIRAATGGGG